MRQGYEVEKQQVTPCLHLLGQCTVAVQDRSSSDICALGHNTCSHTQVNGTFYIRQAVHLRLASLLCNVVILKGAPFTNEGAFLTTQLTSDLAHTLCCT